jgi:hypothetical protein
MRKLALAPAQDGYAIRYAEESMYAALNGGPGAFRRDFIGGVARLAVSWTVGGIETDYLLAFYRTASAHASEPFLIDLALDSYDLQEYEARFIPGTFAQTGYAGTTRTYSAEIEVKPLTEDPVADGSMMDLYEEYGDQLEAVFDLLAELVNETMPAAIAP